MLAQVNATRAEKLDDASCEPPGEVFVPSKNPEQKRRIKRILLTVAILAMIAGGIWFLRYWTVGRFLQSTNDAFLQADQTTVSPKVQGYVEQVYVVANQKVAVGDRLLKIEPSTTLADWGKAGLR